MRVAAARLTRGARAREVLAELHVASDRGASHSVARTRRAERALEHARAVCELPQMGARPPGAGPGRWLAGESRRVVSVAEGNSVIKVAGYYWRALRYESTRIRAWRQRHHPVTGDRYSLFDAWRATVENPPQFDRYWDDAFESLTTQGVGRGKGGSVTMVEDPKIRGGYRVLGRNTRGDEESVWYAPTLEDANALARSIVTQTFLEVDVYKYLGSWRVPRPVEWVEAEDAEPTEEGE